MPALTLNTVDCRAKGGYLMKRCTSMVIEFRVLGEVEAYVDGRRLDVGHARQRSVLVGLLVDVNRPVTADQLIDRVWTDQLPHKARNALASYISRLRQVLPDTEPVRIVRGPAGYTLTADPQSIDLYRFRNLAARARTTEKSADALALFREAQDLWRGEPFTPLDTPWAEDLRHSLQVERFSILLDHNDAALAAGEHTELLADLATMLQQHPLDERVAAQLMLALYRNSRQADALALYRLMRERLVDELGVDPSPELQAAHQSILDGDPIPAGALEGGSTADRASRRRGASATNHTHRPRG